MDWKNYENAVKLIYENLGKCKDVKIIGHGRTCKVTGKSGSHHQIDVLMEHTDGVHTYSTAVECKFRTKKINKDVVMKLHEIIGDCNLNKGIIVSKEGFTPDAIKFAESNGIGLVELREPNDSDWDGYIKNISIKGTIIYPELLKFEVKIPKTEPMEKLNMKISLLRENQFVFPNGQITTLKSYIDSFGKELKDKNEEDIITKEIPFPEGTLLKSSDNLINVNVNLLKLIGKMKHFKIDFNYNTSDYILLVMKLIFENKEFIIDRDFGSSEYKKNS